MCAFQNSSCNFTLVLRCFVFLRCIPFFCSSSNPLSPPMYIFLSPFIIPRSMTTFRLEPMLARIAESRRAVVCPEIDIINAQNLAYHGVGGQSVGGFWWSLHFSWRPMSQREKNRRKDSTSPIRYPKTAGINAFPYLLTRYQSFFVHLSP